MVTTLLPRVTTTSEMTLSPFPRFPETKQVKSLSIGHSLPVVHTQAAPLISFGGNYYDYICYQCCYEFYDDDIYETNNDDRLSGGGLSLLEGRGGNDTFFGRSSRDDMYGGDGDDIFIIRSPRDIGNFDRFYVYSDNDTIILYNSASVVNSYNLYGIATVVSQIILLETSGNDSLAGGRSLDAIFGLSGDDRIYGLGGPDSIFGGEAGSDRLFGGSSGDFLRGESGSDTVFGDSGDDSVRGDSGDDRLFGDEGADAGSGGDGVSTIFDFDANEGERLVFATGLELGSFTYLESAACSGAGDSEARFVASQNRLQIDQDGDGNSNQRVTLDGVSKAGQLSAGDFLWS